MGTRRITRRIAVLAATVALAAPLASAVENPEPRRSVDAQAGNPPQDTYGTASDIIETVQAYEFEPAIGQVTNLTANGVGSRGCTSVCSLLAPVMLPAGALVREIELEACDTDPNATVGAGFFRANALEAGLVNLASTTTGTTPGCAFFSAILATPHTVDNLNGTYLAQVVINNATSLATRFQALRIYYRLQVSPAPATATFPNDVPTTHPFFRFVEALARAGITGGCGTGAYCPDQPVTRGQMAAFLATALGLHFPN
jgi:hypothetical protein